MDNLKIVYEDIGIMRYVRKKVDEVSHIITNIEKLEFRIYEQLESYLQHRKTPSRKRIMYLVDREIDFVKRMCRVEKSVQFSCITSVNDFGESVEFEPEDLLAQVSETAIQNISLKEMIARLATDDRELTTLNAWANGLNDMQISETLASLFGGKSNSHRRFIQRFKAKCQRKILVS